MVCSCYKPCVFESLFARLVAISFKFKLCFIFFLLTSEIYCGLF
uniref:Uncharacterized protein n=1 Tax=Rhizophora mucronata TaxID=61149 RepID=A0A2P2PCE6_RHIMU